MNFFQKEDQNCLAGLAVLGVCVALILVAMFSTLPQPVQTSSVTAKYLYPPAEINISVSQGLRLLMLGLFSGIIGGMMGMGGGVVKASGLVIIFGLEVFLVRSIALITNVFIYGSAAYRYLKKNGLVIKEIAEIMIPGALLGVAFGFLLGNVMYSMWLQRLLGVFALYSGMDMLRRVYFSGNSGDALPKYGPEEFKKENKIKIAGAGFPMGTVMGLFGISGGVIGVPYQRFILKIPLKNAIANTSVTSFVASIFAIFFALWYEHTHGQYGISTPIIMALWIIPGNIVGAQAGSYLTDILPLKFIKLLYVTIMILIGIRLFF